LNILNAQYNDFLEIWNIKKKTVTEAAFSEAIIVIYCISGKVC
jgi:hypothetical protein